ncbi:MAG TPA: dienelactone hydrolase family protein [Acidimicrobiales bacterium]|jgi:carboxymethylenebutenolidase|nr:dienelactone hydrolase family protein [Acidimicrobiales bacterium]
MTDAMVAETTTIRGHGGDEIEAYFTRPLDTGQQASVVVLHHMPGYDRASKEIARTFAVYGYATLMPNLHHRYAPGAKATDAAAAARDAGGVPDEQCLGDVQGAIDLLRARSESNGKVGVIGYCSGGRQTFLVACSLAVDAAVDCYGGRAEVALAPNLRCPLLGLFGLEDQSPSPDDVAAMQRELDANGKTFDFHSYEGAGHAFFSVDRPSYRVDAAKDGWKQIWAFFKTHLEGG